MQESPEAGKRPRGGTAKRQSAKPSGSAKRPGAKTLRVQLHLEEQTVERLRVHTALSHRNDSSVVGEILLSWLARYGKGRELFPAPSREPGEDLLELPDTGEDRQDATAA